MSRGHFLAVAASVAVLVTVLLLAVGSRAKDATEPWPTGDPDCSGDCVEITYPRAAP